MISCGGVADGIACAGGTCAQGVCCTGCVDDRGRCVFMPSIAACGWSGSRCVACAAPTPECVEEIGGCAPVHRAVSLSIGGSFHSCAIDQEGALYCWGLNPFGELGNGNPGTAAPPARIGADRWRAVATGGDNSAGHSCGIADDQSLFCWGSDNNYQLGLGPTQVAASTPTKVDSGPWRAVALGAGASCASRGDGRLACWGVGEGGRLGLDGRAFYFTPTDTTLSNVTSLSYGQEHGAALVDTTLFSWGLTDDGRLGRSGPGTPPAPVGEGFDAVSAGAAHTCGVRSGQLWCWGSNATGELSLSSSVSSAIRPRPVMTDSSDWKQVACGDGFTCALRAAGAISCWGRNDRGQLGRGSVSASVSAEPPREIEGLGITWRQVAAGPGRACAISSAGLLHCWGDARDDALGVITRDPYVEAPTPVLLP
jgi:alpha-tubulin suppressor-like RCC1 family protein